MNTSSLHACSNEAIRPLSADERLASWYWKYIGAGFHRHDKPSVKVTVPAPLSKESQK